MVTTEYFTPESKSRKRKHKELNVTTQDKFQLKMLKILQNIEENFSDRPTSRISNQTPGKTRKKWYNEGGKHRRYTSKYCWTCGATNHKGSGCRFKKEGHKDSATFDNKMGGSTAFCKFSQS